MGKNQNKSDSTFEEILSEDEIEDLLSGVPGGATLDDKGSNSLLSEDEIQQILNSIDDENAHKSIKSLKSIGFWRDDDSDVLIHPKELVGEYINDDKEKLSRYLDTGIIVNSYFGFSHCRFICDESETNMGASDLTDGIWMWPEGLSHYVRVHDVVLPSEFLDQVKKNNWVIPASLDTSQVEDAKVDGTFWNDYCVNNSDA